jgi:hypothetical protein
VRKPREAKPLLVAGVLLATGAAWAQQAGGFSAGPSDAPSYETRVLSFSPSPPVTQTRLFAGSRFWRLDPGQYEVELWADWQHGRDGTDSFLYQAEVEIGLTSHIQLDLYENLQQLPGQGLTQEGNQIELRYSLAKRYGEIWGNPTLYFEWHPRHGAPDRGEVRLLLGGQLGLPHLMGATNLYIEQNIDDRHTSAGIDGELGAYFSASYGLFGDHLRLGAEGKLGGDQHATPTYFLAAEVGPNVVLAAHHWKLTLTWFFGLTTHDPVVEPYLIAGYQFP